MHCSVAVDHTKRRFVCGARVRHAASSIAVRSDCVVGLTQRQNAKLFSQALLLSAMRMLKRARARAVRVAVCLRGLQVLMRSTWTYRTYLPCPNRAVCLQITQHMRHLSLTMPQDSAAQTQPHSDVQGFSAVAAAGTLDCTSYQCRQECSVCSPGVDRATLSVRRSGRCAEPSAAEIALHSQTVLMNYLWQHWQSRLPGQSSCAA